jgi:hypothetical protein
MQTVAVAPNAYTLSASVADDGSSLDVSGFDSDTRVLLADHALGDI